jgi:hypothetical protein
MRRQEMTDNKGSEVDANLDPASRLSKRKPVKKAGPPKKGSGREIGISAVAKKGRGPEIGESASKRPKGKVAKRPASGKKKRGREIGIG